MNTLKEFPFFLKLKKHREIVMVFFRKYWGFLLLFLWGFLVAICIWMRSLKESMDQPTVRVHISVLSQPQNENLWGEKCVLNIYMLFLAITCKCNIYLPGICIGSSIINDLERL